MRLHKSVTYIAINWLIGTSKFIEYNFDQDIRCLGGAFNQTQKQLEADKNNQQVKPSNSPHAYPKRL